MLRIIYFCAELRDAHRKLLGIEHKTRMNTGDFYAVPRTIPDNDRFSRIK